MRCRRKNRVFRAKTRTKFRRGSNPPPLRGGGYFQRRGGYFFQAAQGGGPFFDLFCRLQIVPPLTKKTPFLAKISKNFRLRRNEICFIVAITRLFTKISIILTKNDAPAKIPPLNFMGGTILGEGGRLLGFIFQNSSA